MKVSKYRAWGDEAFEILQKITPPHVRKKRTTIILLADATLAGTTHAAVFKPSTTRRACSQNTHYMKWIHEPSYKAAYDFLIGTADAPGLSRQRRDAILDQQEAEAVAHIATAHQKLQMLAGPAVEAMARGLTADFPIHYKGNIVDFLPDTAAQLRAADIITRRLPTLSPNQTTELKVTTDAHTITPAGLAAAQAQAAAELAELGELAKNGV